MTHNLSKELAQDRARRTLCALASIRFLTLAVVMAWTLPLHAAEQVEVQWNEVCRFTDGHQLTITTTNGDTVDGYCMSINVDEMAVTTKDRRLVKIARAALSRIQMQRSKNEHQLRSLGRGLRWGFEVLLSPYAPVGLAVVPPMLA
jgi:hypothetical protein